jgi:hypothetical protein
MSGHAPQHDRDDGPYKRNGRATSEPVEVRVA